MQKIDRETEKKFLEAEKYRANKDFEKAIIVFKAILDQFPKLPPALHNLALCYTELNKFAEAEKTCVVYGMPRAAVQAGAVLKELPIEKISEQILTWIDELKTQN